MKVILNSQSVVVATGIEVEPVETGLLCNEVIYGEPGLIVTETSLEVIPFKNTLIDGIVGINPLWTISEQAIREKAIDDYTLELLEGGML